MMTGPEGAAPGATVTTTASVLMALSGICKSFPGVKALEDVQFALHAGEVHALMGENGAGKSTLMKIIAGVYRKDAGRMWLAGEEVDIRGPLHAQQLGIGIVHQELHLMPHLTAAQNIFIGREPRRLGGLVIDEARMNQDAARIFARLGLADMDPQVPVGRLTVARQQLVEIAKALSNDSQVLIMDEPTAALNDREIAELFRIVGQLRAEGKGIIYISHKMDEIQRIADRVTVMRDGRYIDTVPAATPMDTLIAMMVGRALEPTPKVIPVLDDREVLLEVRNLRRGRHVRDVSFRVRKGEIVGFAGLMGAGRTEVARAVFGADPIDGGEIHVHGRRVDIRSPQDAVRHGIGYLSEDRKHFGLATGMDVAANTVLAHMRPFCQAGFVLRTAQIRETAEAMVERLRIRTPGVQQIARMLSGGNQQKVVIAKWLVRDCDILFFDEPTRGIDVGAKTEIYKLIEALAAQGRAIVVISSELPEVLRLAHRVIVMCEGRITAELPGDQADQELIMHHATQRDPVAQAA